MTWAIVEFNSKPPEIEANLMAKDLVDLDHLAATSFPSSSSRVERLKPELESWLVTMGYFQKVMGYFRVTVNFGQRCFPRSASLLSLEKCGKSYCGPYGWRECLPSWPSTPLKNKFAPSLSSRTL